MRNAGTWVFSVGDLGRLACECSDWHPVVGIQERVVSPLIPDVLKCVIGQWLCLHDVMCRHGCWPFFWEFAGYLCKSVVKRCCGCCPW